MSRHSATRFAPGTRLGAYEIVGPLGTGGMGEVYLGRDTRLDREVALKVLPSRMTHDAESIVRFRREALTLASLNHPNLATIHGFEETADGTLLLVLERVEGITLAERLVGGALQIDDALQIGVQVAQALEVAHEHGVIHRDIKPSNLMIGPRGLVKVLDFGLARRTRLGARGATPAAAVETGVLRQPETGGAGTMRADPAAEDAETIVAGPSTASVDGNASMNGMAIGTPGYMSPEQVLAGHLDARTDVFSFGCVLYECLTGRRAFTGTSPRQAMRAALEAEPDLTLLPRRVPASVRSLIERCLAKTAADRPESMLAIRLEIEDSLGIRRASALRESGAATVPHNLPSQHSSFIGRKETLRACENALAHVRLLTLLGMGGSGKTRLALRLAQTRLEAFPDGVWFVDVAPLAEAARLDEALAAILDVRDEPGRSRLGGITQSLGSKLALVILDNAETHTQACATLASQLLAACPSLKILATSREPLGLEIETTLVVPSLATPSQGASGVTAVAKSESALLFAERAGAVLPAFEITDGNAGAVAEICRRLDGIPLALELAAARVRMLGVEQIRARLDDRFRLLTRGAGDAGTGRQQTVRAVIQWSWDHLLEPEQVLMRRLAVFAGGWTLERATAVIADDADEFDVLDLLTRLVERSLVVVERDAVGNARYRFLESVWRFAQEVLATDPECDAVRERHLAAYLALAQRLGPELFGPKLLSALTELAPEEENILVALAWCDQSTDGPQRGLRLLMDLYRYWSVLGRYAVGRRLMQQGLLRDAGRPPSVERASVLIRAAGFAVATGDYAAASESLEESLRVSRAVGDTQRIPSALSGLAVVAMFQGRFDDALRVGEEALAAYEQQGQARGVAMALHNLGTAEFALGRGDHGRAKFESALAKVREVGDQSNEALCLSGLATCLIRLGELEAARERLRECLRLLERLDAPREGVYALDAVAELMAASDRTPEAARLLGVANAARLLLGSPHTPNERIEAQKLARRITEALGPVADTAMADGRRLTLEEGLAESARFLGMSWRS